ncbi:hypothetical protein BKM19_000305 (plasmid) [Pseudomonas amygdali pv. morsprunorum]|nr:hypothetical protein BKM19_000305 [Pseudomonas amygdali pv. morsprunorum]POP86743.1 hypothetical protein CXB39_29735 [Pseudomonas amygdali pv. morsprunorum]
MKPAYPPLLLQMSPAYTPRPLKNLFTANGCWADLLEAGGLRQIEVESISKMLTCGTSILVTTCNRNGTDLQSSRFSTRIDCVYPALRTSIDCKRTCIQPLRPAIERNRSGLNATEKPMI